MINNSLDTKEYMIKFATKKWNTEKQKGSLKP